MNPDLILQAILAIGGGGVFAAVINFVLTRPKVRAEAASIATTASNSVIEQLQAENRRLGERVDLVDKKNDDLETENHDLVIRMRSVESYVWRLTSWVRRYYKPGPGDEPMPEPPPSMEGRRS